VNEPPESGDGGILVNKICRDPFDIEFRGILQRVQNGVANPSGLQADRVSVLQLVVGIGAENGWTRPVTAVLENIIVVFHGDLEDTADESPNEFQRGLFGPFFGEVLDDLGGLFHRIVQRVNFRFVFRDNCLPSSSQLRRENKRLPGRRD